jgi:ABC-type molybdate transport system substrate-binding protein
MVPITSPVRAETVEVYAAGSLRGLVTALAPRAAKMGIEIKPVFGGSGDLREKIEKGAAPDIFLSADMAAPRALAAQGRTKETPIAFARNRLCLVATEAIGLTSANMVDRLLAPGVRIRTSRPVADPSGDYAMAMFALMDTTHPGARRALRENAQRQMALAVLPLAPGQNATGALFQSGLIDVAVTYCSASGDLARSTPGLVIIDVPDSFDPKPVFGLALLSSAASAKRLALFLLSKRGQSDVADAGLLSLSSNSR